MVCSPIPAPLKLCSDMVSEGPGGRVRASTDSEHELPKLPETDVAENQVPKTAHRQRWLEVSEGPGVAPG
eukprot:8767465-Alexandrium_andersonii.AAC.1